MTYKLIAALALSLGLGTAAIAQTNPEGSTLPAGQGNAPTVPSWDASISDAFFVNVTEGTLRSEEEIRTNWGGLSAEQQAQVRADCDTMTTTASIGTNTAGVDSNPTTSGTSGAGVAGPNLAGGSAPGTQLHAMNDLCDMVGGM